MYKATDTLNNKLLATSLQRQKLAASRGVILIHESLTTENRQLFGMIYPDVSPKLVAEDLLVAICCSMYLWLKTFFEATFMLCLM